MYDRDFAIQQSGVVATALVAALLAWGGGGEAYAQLPPGARVVTDVTAGTSGLGALFTVDPGSGNRTLLSDFGNAAQGPLGPRIECVAITLPGGLLVTDTDAGTSARGALFAVDPGSGNRTLLSDFGNAAQGPLGRTPQGVALTSAGSILVADSDAGTGFLGALFTVDPGTGDRTLLSDFGNAAQGSLGDNPRGLAVVTPAGDILVVDETAGTGAHGALFSVGSGNGNRTLLSDFGNAAQGPLGSDPQSVALTSTGGILVADTTEGSSFRGALFAVDATTGNRTLFSDFANTAQGPLGAYPSGVALTSAGGILVITQDTGPNFRGALFTVDAGTGNRTLVSDFGNTAQGPLGDNPGSLAVAPPSSSFDCGDTAGPGGTDVPCSCGSKVVTNTLLVSDPLSPNFDPVCSPSGACPGNALRVAPGIGLDLGSRTIRGNGAGIGVDLLGDGSSVRNGKVQGFGIGVRVEPGTGEKVQSVTTRFSTGSGIEIAPGANGTLVRENISEENGGSGIDIQSVGDTVVNNRADSNGAHGIHAMTSSTILQNNTGTLNSTHGLELIGGPNILSGNVLKQNLGAGVVVIGSGNTLSSNQATSNGTDGISIIGNTNTLTSNSGKRNGHDGIEVTGTGNALKGNTGGSNTGDGVVARSNGNVDQRKNSGSGNGGVQCAINAVACTP